MTDSKTSFYILSFCLVSILTSLELRAEKAPSLTLDMTLTAESVEGSSLSAQSAGAQIRALGQVQLPETAFFLDYNLGAWLQTGSTETFYEPLYVPKNRFLLSHAYLAYRTDQGLELRAGVLDARPLTLLPLQDKAFAGLGQTWKKRWGHNSLTWSAIQGVSPQADNDGKEKTLNQNVYPIYIGQKWSFSRQVDSSLLGSLSISHFYFSELNAEHAQLAALTGNSVNSPSSGVASFAHSFHGVSLENTWLYRTQGKLDPLLSLAYQRNIAAPSSASPQGWDAGLGARWRIASGRQLRADASYFSWGANVYPGSLVDNGYGLINSKGWKASLSFKNRSGLWLQTDYIRSKPAKSSVFQGEFQSVELRLGTSIGAWQ